MPQLRLRPVTAIAAGAVALWLTLPGFVNYDTAWSLVWGGELANGRLPRLHAPFAPTPHPLSTLLGVALTPLGGDAGAGALLLGYVALATLAWVVYELGAQWFGRGAGALAAGIVLTTAPLLWFGAQSYADVPYVALVLGALLVEARRPRAGPPVLALLALAGLLRPEAWLFSVLYVVYAAPAASTRRRTGMVALAAAAPFAWMVCDLALAGNALHSFTWTRESAAALGRPRGPGALTRSLPLKLVALAGLPLLAAAGAGLALCWRWRRPAAHAAGVSLGVALLACASLTSAGMPVVMRYLLLPLALLAILAAGGALGWLALPRGDARRGRWAAAGAGVVALLAISLPARVGGIAAQRNRLADQAALRADLREPAPPRLRAAPPAGSSRPGDTAPSRAAGR